MSLSKKYRQFLAESIQGKRLEELPGIGPVAAKNMKVCNMSKAEQVLGMFLDFDRKEAPFLDWISSVSGLKLKGQKECYNALKTFCDQRLL